MFDDGWRTMKYRFYDPKMHGTDWDAMRAKYRPLVEFVGDRQELLNIINEMIGELNASHTGAAPPPRGPGGGGVATSHLGIELEPDNAAGRYRVTSHLRRWTSRQRLGAGESRRLSARDRWQAGESR